MASVGIRGRHGIGAGHQRRSAGTIERAGGEAVVGTPRVGVGRLSPADGHRGETGGVAIAENVLCVGYADVHRVVGIDHHGGGAAVAAFIGEGDGDGGGSGDDRSSCRTLGDGDVGIAGVIVGHVWSEEGGEVGDGEDAIVVVGILWTDIAAIGGRFEVEGHGDAADRAAAVTVAHGDAVSGGTLVGASHERGGGGAGVPVVAGGIRRVHADGGWRIGAEEVGRGGHCDGVGVVVHGDVAVVQDVELITVAGMVLKSGGVVGGAYRGDGDDITGAHHGTVGALSFIPSDGVNGFSAIRNEAPCLVVGRPCTCVAAGRHSGCTSRAVLDAYDTIAAVPVEAGGSITQVDVDDIGAFVKDYLRRESTHIIA